MPRLSSTRKELVTAMMKEAISEAAVSVLAEHGVDGMTMDRVAAAADEVIRADLPATRKLEAILRVVFDQLAKHHGVFNLLLKDDTARVVLEPRRRTNREIAVGQFAAIFRQGIEQGLFRPLDPVQLAEMFLGAMGGLWERSLATGEVQQADSLIQPLMSVFLDGVAIRAGK